MARISGVDIPKQKRGVIALTYIFGVGRSRAEEILAAAKVSEDKKVADWSDEETGARRTIHVHVKENVKQLLTKRKQLNNL